MEQYFYAATITKVIDGDTLDLDIDLGFGITARQRVRLLGVNCPELHRGEFVERLRGKAARDYTAQWSDDHREVYIHTVKDRTEKYGRLLGTVYTDASCTESLNAALLQEGHAKAYSP